MPVNSYLRQLIESGLLSSENLPMQPKLVLQRKIMRLVDKTNMSFQLDFRPKLIDGSIMIDSRKKERRRPSLFKSGHVQLKCRTHLCCKQVLVQLVD